MGNNKYQAIFWFALILTLTGLLLLAGAPVRAQGPLPPRMSPSSGGGGGGGGVHGGGEPPGAYIELDLQGATADVWTVLQWQDGAGRWYDIEQWRGTLDANGRKKWWVAAKDFGTGPFRWVVTQGPDGPVLATSLPFNMPSEAYETVRIEGALGGSGLPPGEMTVPTAGPTPGPIGKLQTLSLPTVTPTPHGGTAVAANIPATGGSFVLKLSPSELLLGWLGGVLLATMAVGTWAAWRWFIEYISRIT
jgi:hypothetical protein